MRTSVRLLVAIVAVVVAGCATPARMGMMRLDAGPVATTGSPLYFGLILGPVTGGRATNPLWVSQVGTEDFRAAVLASLQQAALLGSGDARFVLEAELIGLQQPAFGLAMEVTASVRYVIRIKGTTQAVWEEVVTTSYTSRMGEAFLAAERIRLANEGAVRENVGTLVRRLVNLRYTADGMALR